MSPDYLFVQEVLQLAAEAFLNIEVFLDLVRQARDHRVEIEALEQFILERLAIQGVDCVADLFAELGLVLVAPEYEFWQQFGSQGLDVILNRGPQTSHRLVLPL